MPANIPPTQRSAILMGSTATSFHSKTSPPPNAKLIEGEWVGTTIWKYTARSLQAFLLTCVLLLFSACTCISQSLPDGLVGDWITESGEPLSFLKSPVGQIRGWVPRVPAQIAVSRTDEGGANLKLSGPNLECFYLVSPVEKGFVWNSAKRRQQLS